MITAHAKEALSHQRWDSEVNNHDEEGSYGLWLFEEKVEDSFGRLGATLLLASEMQLSVAY